MSSTAKSFQETLAARHRKGWWFEWLCLGSTLFGIAVLVVLLSGIVWQAFGWLDWQFLSSYDSRFPEKAGILAALWGSVWLILLTALISIPIGVGAALYLEEYAKANWLTRIIQVNLSNLAGVPSIVYGILGLTAFVRMFGLIRVPPAIVVISLGFTTVEIPLPGLPFDRTVMSGALTLSLLILPVVIVASQEALRAIPSSLRDASYALGATEWQTIRHQVLPAALPGILTGVILALSRAIGETAPLVMIGALTYLAFTPGGIEGPGDILADPQSLVRAPFDSFTALPLQIFNWVSRPEPAYQHVAAAGILVLLVLLLTMNATAIFIRHRFRSRTRW